MQKTVLVPLDGSEESEAALPWATTLAQERGLTLTLARVAEYPNYAAGGFDESMSVEVYEQVLEVEEEDATTYLQRVKERLAETGLSVETIMRDGRPAFTLLDLADELSAAAIVIASHGRGGFKRVVLGSVAKQLVAHTALPVFLIRATPPEQHGDAAIGRVLVALDGSVLAESALDVAREVVGAGSTLVLVRIVRDGGDGVALATSYLDQVATRLRATGVVVETRVIVGETKASAVSHQLTEAATAAQVDAIVMSTHGRGGVKGWFVGSVADEIIRTIDRPVLVVSARAIAARTTGQQHVRDVMTRDVMTLQDDESLVVALRKLVRRRASGAPVLDAEGRLVGIISQRDIMAWHEDAVKELSKHSLLVPSEYLRRLQAERVRTVMTTSPTSIPESASLHEAMAVFLERRIHRLPVTKNGHLVGIITGSDILLMLLTQIESVAESSHAQEGQPAADLLTGIVSQE